METLTEFSHDALAGQRIVFTTFLATIFHVLILLGITFGTGNSTPQAAQNIEVTLAYQKSNEKIEEADFIAQIDQRGSGSLDEAALPSTTELVDFFDNQIRTVHQDSIRREESTDVFTAEIITAQGLSDDSVQSNEKSPLPEKAQEGRALMEALESKSMDVASLEAEIRRQQQAYAKRPRRKQLTAVQAKASADAEYLDAWRKRVESIGNLNYPNTEMNGSLTLLVAVRADGTVERIEVRRSSGHPVLDEAAVRILRMAAPFDPFSEEVRKRADILEIIRTWKFESGEGITSSAVDDS